MNRHELETLYSSEIVGNVKHTRLSALVSISEILSSIPPLPVRILDNTTAGENWTLTLLMQNIRMCIFGPSVPTFRFTRWCEIQDQIEFEYARTPEILNSPVESWQSINPELCRLIYLQECRAARHKLQEEGYPMRHTGGIEGIDYTDPVHCSPSPAASLGRKGGQARTAAKTRAAQANGQKGGRPRQERDTSAFD